MAFKLLVLKSVSSLVLNGILGCIQLHIIYVNIHTQRPYRHVCCENPGLKTRKWLAIRWRTFSKIKSCFFFLAIIGDCKVSMLTHTHPHKPLRKIKVATCNHQADSSLFVWPGVWSGDLRVERVWCRIWNVECLYWNPALFKNIEQTKTKVLVITVCSTG